MVEAPDTQDMRPMAELPEGLLGSGCRRSARLALRQLHHGPLPLASHAQGGSPFLLASSSRWLRRWLHRRWLPISSKSAVADLHVELNRSAIKMFITWPSNAAAEFAFWNRDVLG